MRATGKGEALVFAGGNTTSCVTYEFGIIEVTYLSGLHARDRGFGDPSKTASARRQKICGADNIYRGRIHGKNIE